MTYTFHKVLLALLIIFVLFALSCGDDDDDTSAGNDADDDDTEDDDDATDDDDSEDDDSTDDDAADDDAADDDTTDDDDATDDDDDCDLLYPDLKITAHRGATLYAPENTIPAIEKAFELGAHVVEVDVRHTFDGHYVLMHDDTVNRTTDGTGNVSDMTLAEVKSLLIQNWVTGWMYPGLGVPTLEEALAVIDAHDGEVDLDMKTDEVEGAIQVVVDLGLEHRCFVYSGSVWKHDAVRTVSMDVRIQPASSSVEETQALLDHFDPDPEHIEIAGESGFSPQNVALIQSAGAVVFMDALGVRDILALLGQKQAWGKMMEGDVEIIQSDLPGLLVDYWQSLCE